ncbi:MAG: SET domain-containing protein [Mesorhizobium sp.]|nr:MAG: SET domain-containing protein [Mesorhizobium sp.]RWI44279.1 MAG: SET domain-containing protein [Mesorhizobium sp.]RWJ20700.1 MAG: SET domain-containing protein [Mesorhizobium sp.]RWJ83378.1 MAG: SET domain-containing protein [Mesorhizobium sp.]RWK15012.1 MAG: SET domain-containing protein [Mesorhizobium sp.]
MAVRQEGLPCERGSIKKGHTMAEKVFDCNNSVYVKKIPLKGRAVFANTSFNVGDVIERAPTWGFDDSTARVFEKTGLFEYYFVRNDQQIGGKELMAGYVVFGFISIVNHSENPNTKIVWANEDSGAWASIVAINDIRVDEEITHHYANICAYHNRTKFVE